MNVQLLDAKMFLSDTRGHPFTLANEQRNDLPPDHAGAEMPHVPAKKQ